MPKSTPNRPTKAPRRAPRTRRTAAETPPVPPPPPAQVPPSRRAAAPSRRARKEGAKPPVKPPRTATAREPSATRDRRARISQSVSPDATPAVADVDPYAVHKARTRERQAVQVREGQDIGPIPAPANPARREKCRRNLDLFYRTYFPDVFKHPWSPVHKRLIKLITRCVLVGIMLAVGIPRGFGKTSMCERGVLWALCYRHHLLIMLFAATNEAAAEMLKRIHTELTTNPLLIADFPEVCLPLIHMGTANQKGRGQLCQGVLTNVKLRSNELWTGDVLRGQPEQDDAAAQILPGASLWAVGITAGGIRGKQRVAYGQVLRPTMGLADDCQTRASAGSPRQCQKRKQILNADIPFLPGQFESWSFLSTWTVIEPGDVADWVLNRENAPEYHGVRERFLDALPDDRAMELWAEWRQIVIQCQQAVGIKDSDRDQLDYDTLEPAHKFYDRHRTAMHRGAKIVWEHAYDPRRWRSALEKAMDVYFRDRLAFFSELQNDPAAWQVAAKAQLQKFDIATRFGLTPQGVVPRSAEWLTVGIDVQLKVLYWSVRAWRPDSTSHVIEYGTWPGQGRKYFNLSDLKLSIDAQYASLPTWEVRLAAALKELLDRLFNQQWPREDGLKLGLTAGGVDGNYETDKVKAAIIASGYYGRVYPTHGKSFTRARAPLNELPKRDRDVIGDNWRLRAPKEGDVRYVTFDANHFKSQIRDRLSMPCNLPGSMTLFLGPAHEMWADHIVAERCHEKFDRTTGREYEEWDKLPNLDNHLLDCEVINNVVGSMIGCRMPIAQSSAAGSTVATRGIPTMPTSAHPQQTGVEPDPAAKPFGGKKTPETGARPFDRKKSR